MKKLFINALFLLAVMFLYTFDAAASTINVPDDYPTIQAAIDAALPGDIINIAPGTYTAVDRALAVINKPLTLMGSGQSDDPAEGTILDGGTYGYGTDNTGLGIPWPRAIVVQSDNVTIMNMRIRGYQGDQINVGGYAVVARAASSWGVTEATLDNLMIEKITLEDCYYGFRGQNVTGMTVRQTRYEVSTGEPSYAVYINGSVNTVVKSNNFYKGPIWITDAKNATIGGPNEDDGNVVKDAVYNGIWLGQQFEAGTSSDGLIQNNIIDGTYEGGIVVWNWPNEIRENIRILDNKVKNIQANWDNHGGISIWQGVFKNLEIKRNTVVNSLNNHAGLMIQSNVIKGADISDNTFMNNSGCGIFLYYVTRSDMHVNNNIIADNSFGLMITGGTTTTDLDAENNWWGDCSGPYNPATNPDGTGDEVSRYVDYAPWTTFDPVNPTFTVELSPDVLWPPNQKMETITADITETNNCPGEFAYTLFSITSSEDDSGINNGDKPDDIQNASTGTLDTEFDLRKERYNINGRVYTVTYRATDQFGNHRDVSANVYVPHSMGNERISAPGDDLSDYGINLTVSPNPASDFINIDLIFDKKVDLRIRLTNVLGGDLLDVHNPEATFYHNKLDLQGLASGMYIMYINVDGTEYIKKIIKE